MIELPFRLSVKKLKCIGCDFIFLVEDLNHHKNKQYYCPSCRSRVLVHQMGEITVVEEIVKESIKDEQKANRVPQKACGKTTHGHKRKGIRTKRREFNPFMYYGVSHHGSGN